MENKKRKKYQAIVELMIGSDLFFFVVFFACFPKEKEYKQ